MSAARILDLNQRPLPELVPDDAIVIGSGIPAPRLIELILDNGVTQVVQKDGIAFERELAMALDMVRQPSRFLSSPVDCFLADAARSEAVSRLEIPFHPMSQKRSLLDQVERHVSSLQAVRGLRDEILLVADELFTNAAKASAPLAHDERQRLGFEFFVCSDGERLVVGCIDSLGILESTMMLKRIRGCYKNGVAQSIHMGPGGAGIGSFMVYNACVSLYIAVEKNVRTVVSAVFPLGLRAKDTADIPKNIHIVSIGSQR